VTREELFQYHMFQAARGRVLIAMTPEEFQMLQAARALQSQPQRAVVVATPPAPRLVCVEENPGPVKGQSTASGDMAAAASSSGVPRELGPAPLLAPFSSNRNHQRQYAGLSAFVSEHRDELGLMKYLPFTSPGKAVDARLAPSKLIPGTLGLFPTRTSVKPRAKVASYPGVLMFMELHEQFNKEWYVPTALRVPVLDYSVGRVEAAAMGLESEAEQADGQWLVRMVLVGDPRAAGPIINSPFNLPGAAANCKLSTCLPKDLHLFLRKRADAQGRMEVNGDFAGASRLSCQIPDLDTELLLSYDADDARSSDSDGEGFWSSMRSDAEVNQHCDQCFSKTQTGSNPIFLCSHVSSQGAKCNTGRHAQCFPSIGGSWYAERDWFYPRHAPKPMPPLSASMRLPRTRAFMSVRAAEPPLGPPPALLPPPPPPPGPPPPPPSTSAASAPAVFRRAFSPEFQQDADFECDDPFNADGSDGSQYDSDSGSQSHGGSDAEGGAVCSRFSRRSAAPATRQEHRIAALRISKFAPATATLTDAGKKEVRDVWRSFANRHKGRHARWACPPQGSKKEERVFESLSAEFAQLQKCCASIKKVVEHASGGGTPSSTASFHSVAELLRSRLEHIAGFKFSKESLYKAIYDMRLAKKGLFWHGYAVCDTCFSAACGISRPTLYRRTSGVAAEAKRQTSAFTKVRQVASILKDMAVEYGQSLPTAEGASNMRHLVLPHRTHDACREELQQRATLEHGFQGAITSTTFRRAKDEVAAAYEISLNIRKQKKLARCAKCEELQNGKAIAIKSGNATDIAVADRLFKEHTREWQEQRQLFEEKKRAALRFPWRLNVLTLDGMDQQKTSLPHYARVSKHKDSESTLPLRVVGGFWFGGGVPCIAIASFDDVPAKCGGASVTAIERMMTLNYECQDTSIFAPIPALRHEPAFNSPPPVAAAPAAVDVAGPAPMDTGDEPLPPNPKVPFMWPEGLHVTFDNTGSDCKNGHVFRFLGMLVALGVFCYITVSTLLVGHTHDIVDQMFSVWSRQLNIKNAKTLKALHALFRRKYATQIYELKRMVDATKSERGVGPAGTSVPPPIADRLVLLAKELGVQPMMILQSCVINADLWCYKNIPNISAPHVFYLVKEMVPADDADPLGPKVEGVSMYNRFLAESDKNPDVNHRNAYRDVRFGPWTTRYTLLRMHEVPVDDPLRVPALPVDTDPVRECLQQHVQEKNMTPKQSVRFHKQLDKFDAASRELESSCGDCARFIRQLNEVGVIHRPKNATAAQKAKANEQEKAKRTAKRDLYLHMQTVPHESQVVRGFWTKWIERVHTVIRPYYIARGLVAAPTPEQQRLSGRSAHPADLVRDRWEPAISTVRVDVLCENDRGLPRLGDFVITRQGNPYQPFGIGVVIAHNGVQLEGEAEGADVGAAADSEGEGEGEAAASRAEGEDEGHQSIAAAAAPARSRVSRSTDNRRTYVDCDDGADQSESDAEPERAEGAPPRARQAAKSQGTAAGGSRKRATSSSNTRKTAAHSKVARKSAGAAAASSVAAEGAGKATEFTVQWWDFVTVAGKVSPNNPRHIDHFIATLPADAAEKLRQAVATIQRGDFARLPPGAFEHWRQVQYGRSTQYSPSPVSRDQLMWWGRQEKILTTNCRLLAQVWKQVVVDLAEPDDARAES